MEGSSKKEKGLVDMGNSVDIAVRWREYKGDKWQWNKKIQLKKKNGLKKGKKYKVQLKCKKINLCIVWRRFWDWSNRSKVVCEVPCWRFLTGLRSMVTLDQLKLRVIKLDINWEQPTLHHVGDSRHTQNIQINSYWWKWKQKAC